MPKADLVGLLQQIYEKLLACPTRCTG